jgi:arsenate reductase
MKTYPFYYLKSCDTCKKIIDQLPADKLDLINIKDNPLTREQLKELRDMAGSYEALFNTRAQLLKDMQASEMPVHEEDFLQLLLQHYTFLKRPVAIVNQKIFIGNSPKNVLELKTELENNG